MTVKKILMQESGCGEFTADRAVDLANMAFKAAVEAAERTLNLETDEEVCNLASGTLSIIIALEYAERAKLGALLIKMTKVRREQA